MKEKQKIYVIGLCDTSCVLSVRDRGRKCCGERYSISWSTSGIAKRFGKYQNAYNLARKINKDAGYQKVYVIRLVEEHWQEWAWQHMLDTRADNHGNKNFTF